MKKLLSILLLSISLIGYSQERVKLGDLNDGFSRQIIDEKHVWTDAFYEGALFSGVGYAVYSNGQMRFEVNLKDGRQDGFYKAWYSNGQLKDVRYYKMGRMDGFVRHWYDNGQMKHEYFMKDGHGSGARTWDKNGGQILGAKW
jgi:antitoxin component YwqK of YwqJK toxin-antitoxin module